MAILVGIDGTSGGWIYNSRARNAEYDGDFAKSFVRRLCYGLNGSTRAYTSEKQNAKYLRGPLADGTGLEMAISAGLTFINAKRQSNPNEPILLTGYSRGALGAVVVAKRLKRQNINVKALMMFDCVDRHAAFDAEVIPNNVETVKHVIRDPAAHSRRSFGNDGMNYNPPTNYLPYHKFMCTHGGMGGTPWQIEEGSGLTASDYIVEGQGENFVASPRVDFWNDRTNITYAQDARVSEEVWNHCQDFLREQGFLSIT